MKRYSMRYESDDIFRGMNDHEYGMASSLKTAKQYISKCREQKAQSNPRNFRIYDHYAEVDEATGFVPCVYAEA